MGQHVAFMITISIPLKSVISYMYTVLHNPKFLWDYKFLQKASKINRLFALFVS